MYDDIHRVAPDSPDVHGGQVSTDVSFGTAVSSASSAADTTSSSSQKQQDAAQGGGRGRGRAGSKCTVSSSLGAGGNSPVPYVGTSNLGGTLQQRSEQSQQQQKRGMTADGSLELSKSGTGLSGAGGGKQKQSRGGSVDGATMMMAGAAGNTSAAHNNNISSNSSNMSMSNPLYSTAPMVVLEPAHLENAILKAVELGRTSSSA